MVKIRQALQTPVGSIQGGVPPSRVNTNPDDDDGDDLLFPKTSVILLVPENKGQSVRSEEKARLFSRPKWPSLGL